MKVNSLSGSTQAYSLDPREKGARRIRRHIWAMNKNYVKRGDVEALLPGEPQLGPFRKLNERRG